MTVIYRREGSFWGALIMALLLSLPVGCGKEDASGSKDLSKVVARVGGTAITIKRLDNALKVILPEGAGELTEDELREFRKSLLKEIIDEELIIKEAASKGLTLNEEELSTKIAFFKKNYDEKGFAEAIIPEVWLNKRMEG